MTKSDAPQNAIIKIVYFDEESASDYLDMSAGGKATSSSEDVKERTKAMHGNVEASLFTKLSWLPFMGASSELTTGAGLSVAGRSILSKTLSNTILTDYLLKSKGDPRLHQLRNLRVTAPKDSMAYVKMFTPYMVMLRMDDIPVDLARMDEVLVSAKGYYELLGESADGSKRVLRFNLRAFRNNYGLTDLGRMRLVFHGVLVGQTSEHALGMAAEFLASRTSQGPFADLSVSDVRDKIASMHTVLDSALAPQERLF